MKEVKWEKVQIFIILTIGIGIISGAEHYSLTILAPIKINEKNSPPTIELLYPIGDEMLKGVIEISWFAIDPDNDTLKITIQYTSELQWDCSSCPQIRWHNITVNGSNDGGFLWNTTMLRDGEYVIKVVAYDGEYTSEDMSGWITLNNR